MILSYDSNNSCNDLSTLFCKMFPDGEIASGFSIGKTKRRYTMLYGIAGNSMKMYCAILIRRHILQ